MLPSTWAATLGSTSRSKFLRNRKALAIQRRGLSLFAELEVVEDQGCTENGDHIRIENRMPNLLSRIDACAGNFKKIPQKTSPKGTAKRMRTVMSQNFNFDFFIVNSLV